MNRLERQLKQKKKAAGESRLNRYGSAGGNKKQVIPVYDVKGRAITPEKKRRDKRVTVVLFVISAIIAFLYVPQLLPMFNEQPETGVIVTPDAGALKLNSNAIRSNTEGDFDEDGLTNADEERYETSLWNPDTDDDGAYDLYEVNISMTDPIKYNPDVLIDLQTQEDEANGKNVASPYKIGNVILWAGDYMSKAHGSVVETSTGAYRFCDFNGYAQFPADKGRYAYKVEDGTHSLLPYRESENAWKISAGDYVELYDEKLTEVIELNVFGKTFYMSSNGAMDLLEKILPDKGFITMTKKMDIDTQPDTREGVQAEIKKPVYDSTETYRFTKNTNTLNDLQYVRKSISENDTCVAVSLYNDTYGEYLGIVYGYTGRGDLLVADMNTLEPVGVLTITEKAKRVVDQDGAMLNMYYFDFYGLGFYTENGDRISFFASSGGNPPVQESDNPEENQTQMEEAVQQEQINWMEQEAAQQADEQPQAPAPENPVQPEQTQPAEGEGVAIGEPAAPEVTDGADAPEGTDGADAESETPEAETPEGGGAEPATE